MGYNTDELMGFFVGSRLGDGAFVKKSTGHNTYVVFKHAENQYQYLRWKFDYLKSFWLINNNQTISEVKLCNVFGQNPQRQFKFATKSLKELNPLFKAKPSAIIPYLSRLGFVIHMLDDGTRERNRWTLPFPSADQDDEKAYCDFCCAEFGFEPHIYHHPSNPSQNRFTFNQQQSLYIDSLILKYIPSDLDIIKNKILRWNHTLIPTEKQQVEVQYISDIQPLDVKQGSDWIDMRSAVDIELKKGEFALIPLGVAMQLPDGYEAHVVPRSSTFKNFGIIQTNHMGIIDNSYCGANDQWHFPAYALRDTVIHKNDRICQFRIEKIQPHIEFIEADLSDNEDRGGIGSTGKN